MKNKRVLITGGLGFIGSNLAISLVKRGAKVSIVDNLAPNQGGNVFNIEPVKTKVAVYYADIREAAAINKLVKAKDYIFHLARQTDHILSQTDPFPDIDINIRGTAIILEACKKYNPQARFIYVGTRGQYGAAIKLPVNEEASTNPRGIYEVTNLAAEKMVKVYHDIHGINSTMLRLTNVYGPRSQMKHNRYGVVNWFIRQALDGQKIHVYGDGSLIRDFLYIDDAIAAIKKCALKNSCYGEVINVGRSKGESFLYLIKEIVRLSGNGSYKMTPFTKERAVQEPGNFTSDISKITKLTGWSPKISLTVGLRKTIEYYRKYQKKYW